MPVDRRLITRRKSPPGRDIPSSLQAALLHKSLQQPAVSLDRRLPVIAAMTQVGAGLLLAK